MVYVCLFGSGRMASMPVLMVQMHANKRKDWNPLRRKKIFRAEDWDSVHQTLSPNRSGAMFDVCERLVSV